jgi:hypothetical protein
MMARSQDILIQSYKVEIELLRQRCAELEALLERSIVVDFDMPVRVQRALGMTSAAEAMILTALWLAGDDRQLDRFQLDQIVPLSSRDIDRVDPDARQVNTISVWLWKIRKKFGRDAILADGYRPAGYKLGPEMRARMDAVLK